MDQIREWNKVVKPPRSINRALKQIQLIYIPFRHLGERRVKLVMSPRAFRINQETTNINKSCDTKSG